MIVITDKEIYSDSAYIHRIGTDSYFKRALKLPTDTEEMFEEVESIPEPADSVSYNEQVNALIREKYSLSEELSILRQRDTKPDEFTAYYNYAEGCKSQVKEKLNITEN